METKYFGKFRKPLIDMPKFVEPQLLSYKWLIEHGLKELFKEFSPISDYSGKKFDLEFTGFELTPAQYDEFYAKENKLSLETPLRVKIKLTNKTLGTEKEQELFLADFPLMTSHGTFIINGVERVVVPQLARSFGVFFKCEETKGQRYFGAKIMPARGFWIELEIDPTGTIEARIDRKRKFPISSLLRVMGATDEKMLKLFDDSPAAKKYIEASIEADTAKTLEDSYVEIYKRLRDGDLATSENAKNFIDALFNEERYDISKVGRFQFNKRFDKPMDKKSLDSKTLSIDDMVTILKHMSTLQENPTSVADDIDHLGSRRVRFVGEMLQQKLRVGMSQMRRNIQNRMSTVDTSVTMPVHFVSPKPLQARLKEFFTTNQLSQFMQQENILMEIEHLRTLSALGSGGLSRERAGLDVRDVHQSHYGRVCPIQTPEGPNIGLIVRLSVYAKINEFGIIETPYVKVENGKLTSEIVYMNALEEEQYTISHAAVSCDENGKILDSKVDARFEGKPVVVEKSKIQYMDVANNQAFSIATSMIPFLNHDDANRALMGSNMQKQATPCIVPEAPLVATGIEKAAAADTGRLVLAQEAGIVSLVDAKKIKVKSNKGKDKEYSLVNFSRTNGMTSFHQRPSVEIGQKVKVGDVLADTSTSVEGQMALGQNILVAFMSWFGSNYEDAIIISERLVKKSKFTSIHIEEFVVNVRDTKLGPEVTTHDIPNVSEVKLKNLDIDGIVRIGAEVRTGDILVGRITPKGETQLTPEERLLRSIFGEKARDVKDTSKRLEGGKKGRVIGVKVFSRENGNTLESGIIKRIHIEVAQVRNVSVGDKLAGRHGNKGVISRILPEEDMPFMEDGTPVDMILTPLGVPSRMNLGQILEMHLGLAAHTLGYQAIVPPFSKETESEIKSELKRGGHSEDGKTLLRDGKTGTPFAQKIGIGYMYILKLHHMVEDKTHMRSIGPYSLVTQQPLGGKAQNGGQRFGEMEVWALLGYGSAYTLREMLTIKSDDILGRTAAFDAIVKGEPITQTNLPASFYVLLSNLRGLSLDVEMKKDDVAVKMNILTSSRPGQKS